MTITNEVNNGIGHHTNGTNGTVAPEAAVAIGQIRPADIVGEMQVAYLDYAMSVIVARALPDVRDGLKPVHRRILYAMYADLGLAFDKPYKKSARIVGEVLGKYHPHGDVAVYDAMARMAQEFSLRYPLVDGQGNFGSVDGDSPAAMRYTEARLAEMSHLMLDDIEKETVAWKDNFDNSLLEPIVLPAALPNLLINGSNGIAVGMATNIPPHNLGEVVDALAFLIDHYAAVDEITVEQLMRFIQGPDFPTGGIIFRYREEGKENEQVDAIAQGYSVGKSRLVVQAKAHFEELSRGRSRILITELPYQTNKAALIERIAELVRDGKIEGISDLRDESDRTGMRVVIELSRGVEPKRVLADLYKFTPLQQTFGMQMLALVDGQPRMLSLKRMLHLFVQHREEIVRRRSEYDLRRARERAHIVEGLLKALDILDDVIRTIRSSQRVETARTNLMKNFGFSEVQAQAILDMQLRRLAALERTKLKDEFKELTERIAHLEDLLAHPAKILALIKSELLAIKEKYGDARRTQIVDRIKGTLTTTDLIAEETVWVSVSGSGEVRRQPVSKLTATALRQVSRGSEAGIVTTTTRETLYLFSSDGRCARVPVHEIPADGSNKHVAEWGKFSRGDKLVATLAFATGGDEHAERSLFLATERGVVKRVALTDVLGVNGTTVIGVDGKDRLRWVFPTHSGQEVLLVASNGQAIRFSSEDVRSMGLPAGGVGGIKLKGNETLVYAGPVPASGEVITLTLQGFAKRSALADYPAQGRNGGGIVTHKLTERTGPVAAALIISAMRGDEPLVVLTRKGVPKLLTLADIPAMGRGVLGKPVVEPSQGDPCTRIHRVMTELLPATEMANAEGESSSPPKKAAADKSAAAQPAPSTGNGQEAATRVAGKEQHGEPPGAAKPTVPLTTPVRTRLTEPATSTVKLGQLVTPGATKAESKAEKAANPRQPMTAEVATQPTLFAVDVPMPTTKGKSSKVQTVVSVPASQAKKKR
jgi:DNA gyrase subunit A